MTHTGLLTFEPRRATSQRRVSLFLGALVAIAMIAFAPTSQAQTSRDLWVPLVEEFSTVDRNALETVFAEVLGSAHGPTHIVGSDGIASVVREQGFALPSCYEGRSVCTSDDAAVARALGADRVIRATAREQGRVLHLEIFDVQLNQRSEQEVRGTDVRATVFQAVAAVTDATAMLIVDTEPTGAALYLDDQLIGNTPYQGTLAIGAYDVRLELEGYVTQRTQFELRAGDVREEEVPLERLYAEITITSTAPNTEVVVDGDERYSADEPIRLNPGDHEFTVRAPGYNEDIRTLNVLAGETRTYRVTLAESLETLAARKYDRIRARPFTLQLGFTGAAMRSTFNNARVRLNDERRRVECPDSGNSNPCGDPTPAGYIGGTLDIFYDYKWLHLELLGFSANRINLRDDPTFLVQDSNTQVTARAGRELHFRLPSPGIRWQVNSDWSTAFRMGPAVSFQRIEGALRGSDDNRRIRRTDWLLEADVVARYHFSVSAFAYAELDLSFVLDHADTRARVGMTVGIGMHLPDPFGVIRPPPAAVTPPPVSPSNDTSGAPSEL